MKQFLEYFRIFSRNLIKASESLNVYFVTDLEKFIFCEDNGLNIQAFRTGEGFPKDGLIGLCIKEKRPVEDTIPRSVYGKRLKVWVWPIIEDDQVKGTSGIVLYKFHPVGKAFPHFASYLAESFPEGAFISTTDLEKIVLRQGSDKFDMPQIQVGTPLAEGGAAVEALKTQKPVLKDLEAGVYGTAIRSISVPVFDPDDKNLLVGAFNISLPRNMAYNLQEVALKLSSNAQEVSAAVEEVAASAGEISTNEVHLTEKVQEVARISIEINEVLDFIKNVADQTKMLGLNAAIEAARAGELGRGFGVVAEEIRKLSDQSKETADRIRKLTKEIEQKIKLINEVSDGTLKQSQEQAAATQEVSASVMEMALMTEKLAEMARAL